MHMRKQSVAGLRRRLACTVPYSQSYIFVEVPIDYTKWLNFHAIWSAAFSCRPNFRGGLRLLPQRRLDRHMIFI